jgi:methionyl-tRNA synthetase
MSKSVGNVVDPFALVDEYGVDFVRFFLCSEVPFGNDGDFSEESFALRINSNLANELGNLVQRVVTMVKKNCDGTIPEPESGLLPEDLELIDAAGDALALCKGHMDRQALHKMVDAIINVARMSNKYIDTQAPWTLKKTDVPRMRTVLYTLAETIRRMTVLLEPVIPVSCARILDLLGAPDNLRSFASVTDARLAPGTPVLQPVPIFPRIEWDAKAAS